MLNKFADTIKEKPIIGWAVFGVVLALVFLLGLLSASVPVVSYTHRTLPTKRLG